MTVNESQLEETEASKSEAKFGAIDIVEAFTALRQDLKVQVRGNRDLQRTVTEAIAQLESRLSDTVSMSVVQSITKMNPVQSSGSGNDQPTKKVIEALAEIDETIQRIVDGLDTQSDSPSPTIADRVEEIFSQASWITRLFAGKTLDKIRQQLSQEKPKVRGAKEQAIVLLSDRVTRLMGQFNLKRIDVKNAPFDPERMRAVDVIDAPGVPQSHVAEQLRPAYTWQDQLLRFAEVRLAK